MFVCFQKRSFTSTCDIQEALKTHVTLSCMMILISALAWRPQGRTVPRCSVLFQQLAPKISPLSTEQKVGNEGYKLARQFATLRNHISITSLAWEHILVFILIWPDSNQYSIHKGISTSTEPHNTLPARNISAVVISKWEVCSPERQLQDLILRNTHVFLRKDGEHNPWALEFYFAMVLLIQYLPGFFF